MDERYVLIFVHDLFWSFMISVAPPAVAAYFLGRGSIKLITIMISALFGERMPRWD